MYSNNMTNEWDGPDLHIKKVLLGPSQQPLLEQTQASNLHGTRPEPVTATKAGQRQQPPQEQEQWSYF